MSPAFEIAFVAASFLVGSVNGWLSCEEEREGRGGHFPGYQIIAAVILVASVAVGVTLRVMGGPGVE